MSFTDDELMEHDGDDEVTIETVDDYTDERILSGEHDENEGGEEPEGEKPDGDTSEDSDNDTEDTEDEPTQSYLTDDDDDLEDSDDGTDRKTVPVHELVKERRKRQALEKRLEGQSETDDVDDDPLKDFKDDDYLTAADVREARNYDQAKLQKERTADRNKLNAENRMTDDLNAEDSFRAKTPNYDAVMKRAIKSGAVTRADRDFARGTENPAKTLFNRAKRNLVDVDPDFLSKLTKESKPAANENLSQKEILETDIDVIDELFPEAEDFT